MPTNRLPLDSLQPDEAESAVAERAVELLYFYDSNGRQVAIFEEEEDHVFFDLTDREQRRMQGGRIVHNHPPARKLSPDDPRYDSASFSPFDWRTAVDLNVSAVIAVSPSWRHELIRPEAGWLSVHRPNGHLLEMLDLLHQFVRERDKRRVAAGELTDEEAEANRMHEVNEIFAGEIKATYRRERR